MGEEGHTCGNEELALSFWQLDIWEVGNKLDLDLASIALSRIYIHVHGSFVAVLKSVFGDPVVDGEG
jgi:hypothetical protein